MTKKDYLGDATHWPGIFRILGEEIAGELLAKRTDIAAKPDADQWERARKAAVKRLNEDSSILLCHVQLDEEDLLPFEEHAYTYLVACYKHKLLRIVLPEEAELVTAAQAG